MKVVKLNGAIVYKQMPDFEDGAGIKNAEMLFGPGDYTEEDVPLKDIPVEVPKERDLSNFEKANSIATLKEALKPLLRIGG